MDKIQNLAENAFKLTKVPDGLGGYYRLYETKAPQQKSSLFLALVNGTTLVLSPEPEEVLAVLEKGAGWRKTGLRHPEIQAALNKLDEKQALRVVVLGSALAKNGAPSLAGLESLAAGATVSEGMEGEFFFTFKEADVAAKALSPFEKELRALEPQVRDAAGKNKLLTPLVELVRSATVRAQGNTLVVKGRVSAAVLAQTFQPDAPAQPLIPKGPNPYLPVRPPVVRANPQDASDATPLLDKESGRLVVLVPAQARLEIAGVQTRQTGEIRRFDSPPISRGETFHYHVKATWQEGGRNVVREKEVQILAGEETQVDLR